MPGCGKTTAAKKLAELLPDFESVDIDQIIEQKERMTITKIFEEKGEEYFRKCEQDVIKSVSSKRNQIISTGGGCFEDEENRLNLAESGIIFFLDCDLEVLFERTKSNNSRPLLQSNDILEKIKDLYNKRIKNYQRADFTINSTQNTELIAAEILRIYNNERDNY